MKANEMTKTNHKEKKDALESLCSWRAEKKRKTGTWENSRLVVSAPSVGERRFFPHVVWTAFPWHPFVFRFIIWWQSSEEGEENKEELSRLWQMHKHLDKKKKKLLVVLLICLTAFER